jgi:hypothetical protein
LKSEERIKNEILDCFSRYCESAGPALESERQKLFGRLVTLVFKWCTDYPFFVGAHTVDARKMGVEIFQTVKSCLAQPLTRDVFLGYLKKSLNRAWAKYWNECEAGLIKIPKNERARLREIEKILEIPNRPLSTQESIETIARWYNIPLEKARAYLEMRKKTQVESLDGDKPGRDFDVPGELFFFDKSKDAHIREAVEAAFADKQERARSYIRKLFTLKHIKSLVDFEGDSPVIDQEIVETARRGEKLPSRYEILLDDPQHSFVDKNSAGVYASKELAKFEKKLRSALENIYPQK